MSLETWLAEAVDRIVLPPKELRTPETVTTLVAEAMQWIRQDLGQARRHGLLAQKLAKHLRDRPSEGRAERILGHVELLKGKSKAANRRYELAYDLFDSDPIERANTAVAMVQSLAYVGEYDRAFEIANAAITTYTEGDDPFRAARIRANVGNVLHRLDRYEEARTAYEAAMPVLAEHRAEADLAIVMRNYGVCLMGLLEYEAADRMYGEARAVFEQSEQALLIHEIDLNRAYLLGRSGRLREALIEYRRLREQLPQDLNFEIGHCLLDEADFMIDVGLWQDGFHAAERAARTFSELGNQFELGKSHLLMGLALLRRGNKTDAKPQLAQAKRLLRKEPNRNWHALLHQAHAELAAASGDHDSAKRSIELALNCPPGPERIKDVKRKWLRLKMRTHDIAAIESELAELEEPALWMEFHSLAGNQAEADQFAHRSLARYDERRKSLGSEGLRRSIAAAERENLERCLATLAQPADRLGVVVRLKDQALADAVGALRLEQAYETRHADGVDDQDQVRRLRESQRLVESATSEWRVPTVGPHERFIEFFDIGETLLAFVLDRSGVREVSLGPSEEFWNLSRLFNLNRARETGGKLAHRALDALGQMLAPVLDDLPSHVLVGRDGPLMDIPIHAAWHDSGYLMDQCMVSYCPSASVWSGIRNREPLPRGSALVYGSFDTIAPEIEDEVAHVSKAMDATPLSSFESLTESLPKAGHIHLAAHGFVREDLPMMSGMRLGGQILSALDVLRMNLQANLAVLSGCSTGVSIVGESRDNQGFIESFLVAGCRNVVASLWDAHDAFAAAWMYQFYAELPRSGAEIAYTKATQITREQWHHPGIWATFGLFGPKIAVPVSTAE